jgi:DNA replication and repair protein RecF
VYAKRLKVKNFRNYSALDIEFSPHINIIQGKNAQGKTNLLEAIYFCATGRSHRTSFDRECIKQDEEEAMIQLRYQRYKEDVIELHLRKNGRKSIAVNAVPAKKIDELFGCFHVVVFSPEDLSLIKNGPSRRRRFMDMEICQVDTVYVHHLQQYCRVLRQRNQLLKDAYKDPKKQEQIQDWDRQLAYYGVRLIRRREEFMKRMTPITQKLHRNISHGTEQITLDYENGGIIEEEAYVRRLQRDLPRDLRFGNTSFGPHHDDIGIRINGDDIRSYGSQGQQRTAALSLKLAEVEMMKQEIGYAPVLLLDDVMSELDEERQLHLLSYMEENQTIVTCTGIEDSIRKLPSGRIFEVEQGQVR